MTLTVSKPAAPDRRPAARGSGLWSRVPRRRRGEFALGIACVACAIVSLLVVTGYVPGVFATSPLRLTETSSCARGSAPGTGDAPVLPAWASVRVSWAVRSPSDVFALVFVTSGTGQVVYDGLGTNGSGSFDSIGGAYTLESGFAGFFQSAANQTCVPVVTVFTLTYTTG